MIPLFLEIIYLYNATGQKVGKKVIQATNITNIDYLAGFQYHNSKLKHFPHAEGYVNVVDDKFKHVFNYTDHIGNIRLSYSLDPSTNVLKIIEENHYYPFGLKHTGYNSDQMMYVKEEYIVTIKPKPPLFKTSYNKKFNGKSWETDLSLNIYDFHARGYMPDIVRTFQQDPKSEEMRRWSPYSFFFDNPMRFVDPDGMKPVDWIKWKGHDGQQHITYDPKIKNLQQAKNKGYSTATQVFETGRGTTENTNEVFNFQKGGKFTVNGGEVLDVANGSYKSDGGNIIDRNKSGIEQFTAIGQGIGDSVSAIGLATAQPELVGIGEIISNGFLGIQVVDSFVTNGVNQETVTDAVAKIGLNVVFGELGKAGIKGSQIVAGEKAVKAGENIISESIIQGTAMAGNKAADKIIE